MLARLLREAKQGEEEERGEDVHPLAHHDRDEEGAVRAPDERRDLLDVRELRVRVRPGDPGREGNAGRVDVDAVRADGDRAHHFGDGEEHEAEVAADGHRAAARGDDFVELDTMPQEAEESHDCSESLAAFVHMDKNKAYMRKRRRRSQ